MKKGYRIMDLFTDTVYWGIFISVGSYIVCDNIQRKKKLFVTISDKAEVKG